MAKNKEQLTERIKELLDIPVYPEETREKIFGICAGLDVPHLAAVASTLALRYHWIQKLSADPTKIEELKKTLVHLEELTEKYGLSS